MSPGGVAPVGHRIQQSCVSENPRIIRPERRVFSALSSARCKRRHHVGQSAIVLAVAPAFQTRSLCLYTREFCPARRGWPSRTLLPGLIVLTGQGRQETCTGGMLKLQL